MNQPTSTGHPVSKPETRRAGRRRRRIEALERRYAGEPEVRRELRIILSPFSRRLTVAILGLVAVIAASFYVVTDANDRQDKQTLQAAVGTCERGNITRADINELNAAADAIVGAVDAIRLAVQANADAVDGTAAALIAALTPSGGLDPEDQARADAYLAATNDLTALVRAQLEVAVDALDIAVDALASALLSFRDCRPDIVLTNPSATLPPAG